VDCLPDESSRRRARHGAGGAAPVIALHDVTKQYRTLLGRPITALAGVSLQAHAGEVVGIAGPNGAGKSTLLGVLLGFLAPTGGRLTIDGEPPRRWIERHGVGYVPETPVIPPRWTLEESVLRYATLANVPPGDRHDRREAAIARLGLADHRRKRIRQLSRGTRQRAAVAQALVRRERLYVFDEPSSGLDPLWTIAFREIVAELRGPDVLILIASHDLDELERTADRVLVLHQGTLRGEMPTGGSAERTLRLTLMSGAELVPELIPEARPIGGGTFEMPGSDPDAVNEALAALIARGGRVAALEPVRRSLEQQFRELVRDDRLSG
jgi:ABC-type multidrug transport system ATPase subunit